MSVFMRQSPATKPQVQENILYSFRHERHRSVVPFGDIAQDVFVILHVVAHAFEQNPHNAG